jgi:hypothetical protein
MAVHTGASAETPSPSSTEVREFYQEGIIAGIIAAAVVAVWFLIVDSLNGRPLYTPSVLGTVLFRRGTALAAPEAIPISIGMVAMFTWVHGLLFAALGGIASRLLGMAERNPNIGFGVILLFVIFQACFTAAVMLFAPPVMQTLGWPAILVANFLAAAAMGLYFWFRHPRLKVNP